MSRARTIGAASVEYVPDRSHRHEGHHRIAVGDTEIVLRPDGVTKGRKRSDAAKQALDAAHEREASDQETVEQVVGALVLAGATNIEVDGQPILTNSGDHVASIRLDISELGTIHITSLGGAG